MIDQVKIKNYRSLADVDVRLGKLTVLVGRNGAGKSTFLDVLRFVRDALRFNLETAIDSRGGIATLCRWVSSGRPLDIDLGIDTHIDGYMTSYGFVLARTQQSNYKLKREVAYAEHGTYDFDDLLEVVWLPVQMEIVNGKWLTGQQIPIFPGLDDRTTEIITDERFLQLSAVYAWRHNGLASLREALLNASFYTIFPNTLRLPQKPSSETVLNDNGDNLGSALKHIIAQDVWKADLILAMRKLVGDVIDIRVRSIGGYLVTEIKHQSSGKRDKWFELAQESDRTLRMLGLLVALYQDPPPALIAIEEPELTIHPGALAILSDVLREASERSQIIVTTQSPDLVSYFKADEIQVVERVDGSTEIGPIDEVQRVAISDHLFTGGELLRMEGLKRATALGGVGA